MSSGEKPAGAAPDVGFQERAQRIEQAIDPKVAEIWEEVPETKAWPEDTRQIVKAMVRAAYGKGYHDALLEELPGQLLVEAGYAPALLAKLSLNESVELPRVDQ